MMGINVNKIYAQGYEKGYKDITERLNKLNKMLLEAGRLDDLIKASEDKDFQDNLLKEFGLDKKSWETFQYR